MSLQEIMSYLTVFTVGILVGYVLKVVMINKERLNNNNRI